MANEEMVQEFLHEDYTLQADDTIQGVDIEGKEYTLFGGTVSTFPAVDDRFAINEHGVLQTSIDVMVQLGVKRAEDGLMYFIGSTPIRTID